MGLKPLGDRLIVRAIEEEEKTASGLVLPDTAKEKPQKGKVIAVGDGRINEDTGKRTPLDVAEGDEVLYSKYGGTEIKVDGEDLLVLRESDVLAKVTATPKAAAAAAAKAAPAKAAGAVKAAAAKAAPKTTARKK